MNNNGNVTFQSPMSTYTPFTINADTPPMIAPFFADVDTRNTLSHMTTYGVTTYEGRPAFCVNWSRVGYFANQIDKTNTFQLIIAQINSQGDFDIVFNYASIKWEAGSASGGAGGLGGTPAGAGFSNGDGNSTHFAQLTGSLQPGAFLDANSSTGLATHSNTNPAVPGRYSFRIASGTQVTASNTCTPYYFVALVGSGEDSKPYPNANHRPEPSATHGLDPDKEMGIVYDAFVEKSPNAATKTTVYQVPYQSLGTDTLGQNITWTNPNLIDQFFNQNLPRYIDSVFDGVNKTIAYLGKVRRDCASQHITPKFFLVGYSQGALAIHLLLQDEPTSFSQYVGFVGLIADPAAVPNRQELINWGTTVNTDYGVCQKAKYATGTDQCGTRTEDIPAAYQGKTESVCNTKDPVCSTSTSLTGLPGTWISKFKSDSAIHSQYRTTNKAMAQNLGKSIGIINHLN